MTPDGEVAVRNRGQETAVAAPSLEERVLVDLDGEQPTAHVPTEFAVEYHDTGSEESPIKTDGGQAFGRTEVDTRGFNLSEDATIYALILAGVLLFVGGYLGATGSTLVALLTACGGVALGWIGALSFRSDPA